LLPPFPCHLSSPRYLSGVVEVEQAHTDTIRGCDFNAEKGLVVTAGDDKKIVVWEFPSMKVKASGVSDKKTVGVAIDSKAEHVLFAEKSGEVFRKPVSDLAAAGEHLLGHISSLSDLVMTSDGKYVLSADRDEKVRVSHYPASFEIEGVCLGHTEMVTCVCVHNVGKEQDVAVSGGADGTVRLWKLPSGELLDTVVLDEGGGEQGGGDSAAKNAEPASDSKQQRWDQGAAGTAQMTALVASRMRVRCTAASVVSIACSIEGLVAVTLEGKDHIAIVRIDAGKALVRMPDLGAGSPPLGVCWAGAAGGQVLVAATPIGDMTLAAFKQSGKGDKAKLEAAELSEGASDVALRSLWVASGEVGKLDIAKGGAEASSDGFLQKRRKHAGPDWKPHSGKQ